MKKWPCLFALLLLAVFAGGCAGSQEGKIFRYDLAEPPVNLDPQFATDATSRMVIENIFEGLLVQDPQGNPLPGAAESYTPSPDGLRYEFTLREGLCWSDGEALTAGDFVFALRRLFEPGGRSPYAADFLCLSGAAEILRGEAPVSALGVRAEDDRTLVITLAYPSPILPELLSSTAAMPCSERFFREARGRYGLEKKYIRSNGPFTLERWEDGKPIQLRKNEGYKSDKPVLAGGVNLYIGREDPAQLFLDGKSDAAVLSWENLPDAKNAQVYPFERTVWCIVFNQNHPLWGNALLRQGLAQSLDREILGAELPPNLRPTEVFIPPAMRLLDRSYRAYAGDASPLSFDAQQGRRLFELGLREQALQKLPGSAALFVPDSPGATIYMGLAQQSWQKHLSAYINLEKKTALQVEDALRAGEYQMLLMPFSPATPRIQSLLGVFASDAGQNYFGYRNGRYDALLAEALRSTGEQQALEKYRQAESMLLLDAVVIPVYFETTYLAAAQDVQGLEFSPFAGRLSFKYATKS